MKGLECPKCGKTLRPRSKTPSGKTRWECRTDTEYCYSTTSPNSPPRKEDGSDPLGGKRPVFKRKLKDTKRYIVTAAQNATPVHEIFWNCLKKMADHLDAEILVAPIRYKNPTSRWTESQANEEKWAEEVTPYLWNVRKVFNQNLMLLGDIKTQPTASNPVGGFEGLSGGSSAILGHTKMQLKSVAAPANRMAKIVTTTGACTVPNYTDSKAGSMGKFHHTLGALIVEVEGKRFHLRQLNFDKKTESFTDLDTRYHEDKVVKAPRALALVMGDSHVRFISPDVKSATFGKGGIVDILNPQHLVWHDLLDAYTCNPHHVGNVFNKIAKIQAGQNSVVDEVREACEFVAENTPEDTTSVVVPSNHNDFLRRWIVNTDWRMEPGNAEFYLKTALAMVRGTKYTAKGTEYPSPFPMVFPEFVDCSNIKLLETDENFTLAGVELSMHGDRGPNGSRGTIGNHRRLGVKCVIGHSHSPGVEEGAWQCGTSTNLRLEYNEGPSSWLNAHVLLNADGKRQMLIVTDGHWRSE